MPKFLDTPSWYDSSGQLRTLSEDMLVVTGNSGYLNIPKYTGGSGTLNHAYVFDSTGSPGSVAIAGEFTYPSWTSAGTSGQVLTSNGTRPPTWSFISFPNAYLIEFGNSAPGRAATDLISFVVFSQSNINCQNMNDVEDVVQNWQNDGVNIRMIFGFVDSSYWPYQISYYNKTSAPISHGIQILGRNSSGNTVTAQISSGQYSNYNNNVRTTKLIYDH